MEYIAENKNNQLSLRWNGFTDNIITSLELSLGNQDFVDVTLVCEGGSIKAHRLVLSACSSFFQRILKENVCSHPVIVLKGIALSELEPLLMFIYHGEARTYEENVPRLLEAAQFLEIKGLSSYECSQVSSEPVIANETTEKFNDTANDFLQTGVHSTTQEFNGLFSHVETFNPFVRTTSESSQVNECQEKGNERIDIDIKQEPLNEEESNYSQDSQNVCGQIVSSQTQMVSKTKLGGKLNSCLPQTNFSVEEMKVLQQQKKLAFYEPRPCPKCHKMYRDAATLRNHLTSMHEILRHSISCSCGALFPTKHDLYVHRKKHHKGIV